MSSKGSTEAKCADAQRDVLAAAQAAVSVVVPAWNAASYMAETLDSVLAQTCRDWELVVVDDGSTDGTAAILDEYARRDPRIRVVRQANAGVAEARSRGVREASPDARFVLLLDHDDVLAPNALEELRAALECHPEAAAAYGAARFVDARGHDLDPRDGDEALRYMDRMIRQRLSVVGVGIAPRPNDRLTTFRTFIVQNCIASSGAVLIRREALAAAGGFDPATVPCDDWDMWLRLTARAPFVFTPAVVLSHRRHAANVSRDLDVMTRAAYATFRKAYAASEADPERRRAATVAFRHAARQQVGIRLRAFAADAARGRMRSAAAHLRRATRDLASWTRGCPL